MNCRRCNETKNAEDFPKNKRVAGGYDRMCKACWKADAARRKSGKAKDSGQRNRRQETRTQTRQPQNGMKFYTQLSLVPKGPERRALFMRLVKENHPDVGGTHEAMVELNEAWRLLK